MNTKYGQMLTGHRYTGSREQVIDTTDPDAQDVMICVPVLHFVGFVKFSAPYYKVYTQQQQYASCSSHAQISCSTFHHPQPL